MDPSKEDILSGFQINWTSLRDGDTGELLWIGNQDYSSSEDGLEVHLPKKIFECKHVLRNIVFSSIEPWENLRLRQIFTYKGNIVDTMFFEYGVVPPYTITTWTSQIVAAPEAQKMPIDILSGNVVMTSKFYNNETLISTSRIKVFYV